MSWEISHYCSGCCNGSTTACDGKDLSAYGRDDYICAYPNAKKEGKLNK